MLGQPETNLNPKVIEITAFLFVSYHKQKPGNLLITLKILNINSATHPIYGKCSRYLCVASGVCQLRDVRGTGARAACRLVYWRYRIIVDWRCVCSVFLIL